MNEAEWGSVLEECYARVLRALVGVSGSRETAEDGLQGRHALERLRNDLQKEEAGWTSKRV